MMRSSKVSSDRNSKTLRRRDRGQKNHKRRRRLAASMEQLEARYLLAFTTELLGDINQLGVSALVDSVIEYNNEAIFVANDGQTGSELWKSDGTEQGTVLIADLLPGPEGSQPENLTIVNGEVFFTALDADDEFDIWKTDGTTAGTVKVFDADASGVYYPTQLTESGGQLFFTAYEVATGYELWVSDGTSAGTMLVRDINPDQSIIDPPQELTDVNGTLFFSSYTNGYDNRELFKSDGTTAGTVLVKNIDGDPYESSNPSYLTNVGGVLFFAAESITDGVELYKSDGTTAGTVQVQDLHTTGSSYPQELTPFAGQVLFSANDGTTGRQLFRSDGSTITLVADTTGVGDPSNPTELTVVGNDLFFASVGGVVPGPVTAVSPTLNPAPNSNSFNNAAGVVISLTGADRGQLRTAVSSGINFTARVGNAGAIGAPGVGLQSIELDDLYLHDIDANDLQVDAWDWTISDPGGLTGIDFSGFISGNDFQRLTDEGVVFELFLNGSATPTATQLVQGNDLDDWNAGRDANNLSLSNPGGATITTATVRMTLFDTLLNNGVEALVVGAQLTATGATSGTADRELHKTDAGFGTSLVKNIVFVGPSNPSNLTDVNGELFFSANDPLGSGRELWTSDGTEGGTVLVEDIRTGTDAYGAPLSGDPQHLTEVNGKLFFTVLDDLDDRELWSSEGSAANTQLIKNINEGSQDANIQHMTTVGNKVFFVADDGINGEAVWMADPAAKTVTLAADLTPGSADKVSGLAEFDGGVAFFHDSLGIYHTDGTTTTQLNTLTPVELDAQGTLFVEAAGILYYVVDEAGFGEELFSTTTGGVTSRVIDLQLGSDGSDPRDLVEFNGFLYFTGDHRDAFSSIGREVFRTDGTSAGTINVANINTDTPQIGAPEDNGSFPDQLTVSGTRLFFTADDGTNGGNGRELWSTTGLGATLALDIDPGGDSSNPINLTDVSGVLYFAADDGTNGLEPFKSDGTGAGTAIVDNVNGGGLDSNPNGFLDVGGTVYFTATESLTGTELWKTDGTPAGTMIVDDLQPGVLSSNPIPLADVGSNRLLISAVGAGTLDRELWIAGGVVAGMELAADINPGPSFGSHPRDLTQIGPDSLIVVDDGFSGEEVFALIEFAPQVEEVIISGGAVQRSSLETVDVVFNSIVEIAGDPFAFFNTTLAAAVVDTPVVSNDTGKTIVSFTFQPGTSVNPNNLLLDGVYELTIDASLISSFGLLLDGNGDGTTGDNHVFGDEPSVDKFYRKFGDNNANNVVDLFDFAAFRATNNKAEGQPGYNDAFDNEGNNVVNLFDFAAFRNNFGS